MGVDTAGRKISEKGGFAFPLLIVVITYPWDTILGF